MHWDVSGGYTKHVCDWFFWHIDRTADRRRRGIPFIVPKKLTVKTLDAFAKLFTFNTDGEGMKFHSCPLGGNNCPQFSCFAHLLFHMETANMVGCKKAEKLSITNGYAWNAMPGYLIDQEILEVLERTRPVQNRRHNLIVGNKPPCRFEQRANVTYRRAWHHDKHLPFSQQIRNNTVLTNHKEGNNEYIAFSKNKGLELVGELRPAVNNRAPPLTKEHPHVYKMPFLLDYNEWPMLAKMDFDADTQKGLRRSEDNR